MDEPVSPIAVEPAAFLEPGFKARAFPVYARLRATAPVSRIFTPDGRPLWLVVGYDEGLQVLRDHQRFGNDFRNALTEAEWEGYLQSATAGMSDEERAETVRMNEFLGQHLLAVDPPNHSRLRRLVSQSFTPRYVEGLRPRIQAIADELVDAIVARAATGRRTMDLVDDFAFPLPITVIAEMLGIPIADREKFRAWSNAVVRVNPAGPMDRNLIASMTEFADYLKRLVAEKRRRPTDDLMSGLVRAETEGDTLTENEVLSMMFLLITAGHETTVNLIANGMLALFEHPDQLERLRTEPALIKGAIEEFLRFYGPVEMSIQRYAREDTDLAGEAISRGEEVQVILASANRDATHFADPDRFDVGREPGRHLAFGMGIHACLGAALARLEGEIAFTTLLARLPAIRLAVPRHQVQWRPDPGLIRGVAELPVAF